MWSYQSSTLKRTCHVMSCDVVWCEVTKVPHSSERVMWCSVMSCDVKLPKFHTQANMSCDVMWCLVMSCDVMWCEVTKVPHSSEHVMWCRVMWSYQSSTLKWTCHVMSCDVVWYRVMWSYQSSTLKQTCHVMSCDVKLPKFHTQANVSYMQMFNTSVLHLTLFKTFYILLFLLTRGLSLFMNVSGLTPVQGCPANGRLKWASLK